MKTTSNAPKIQNLVVCKITKIENLILSIVHLHFQELQRVSKSRKWRVKGTIQEDKR